MATTSLLKQWETLAGARSSCMQSYISGEGAHRSSCISGPSYTGLSSPVRIVIVPTGPGQTTLTAACHHPSQPQAHSVQDLSK